MKLPRNSREAACFGKETFLDYGLANRVAMRMQGKARKVKMKPYRCAFCGNWHIGPHSHRRPLSNRNSLGSYRGKQMGR